MLILKHAPTPLMTNVHMRQHSVDNLTNTLNEGGLPMYMGADV